MSIHSPTNCEICCVIRYLVWKGKIPIEIYNEVKTAYGDTAMNCISVFKWCCEFKNGCMSVHDDQRSKIDENSGKNKKMCSVTIAD